MRFQLDHTGQTQDLPKIHLSTSTPPPSKKPRVLCHLVFSKRTPEKNTIWRKGCSHYSATCTMPPTFSTRPCRTNPRLAKDSHLTFHPPLQSNHGSFVILSSQKRNQKTPFFICLHWSMQEKSKTCQRFTSCTFLSMEWSLLRQLPKQQQPTGPL